jgi:hypothetical protein
MAARLVLAIYRQWYSNGFGRQEVQDGPRFALAKLTRGSKRDFGNKGVES